MFTVAPLILAECIENRGRFLAAIEQTIRTYASYPTWISGREDDRWDRIDGVPIGIDLSAAQSAWNLATTYHWLGDRLSEDTRKLIRDQLERRIFASFTGMVRENFPNLWWLKGSNKNNWNAVCLACVTGSALAVIESRERRAFFVAAAEKYIQGFLSGYTSQGYCSEGLGYWNFGFGHFVYLAESIYQATDGQVDMFDDPHVRKIARFGSRMEVVPGVYPSFADCRLGERPSEALMAFLSRRYGWGFEQAESQPSPSARRFPGRSGRSSLWRLYELAVYRFSNSATSRAAVDKPPPVPPRRDYFPEAGVLICRPAPDNRDHALGVALKGGHNGEHHNHNDVGSFVVALAGKTPLVDPGRENYSALTFTARRYESKLLSSFGHSVPRVAARLQRAGRAAADEVPAVELIGVGHSVAGSPGEVRMPVW